MPSQKQLIAVGPRRAFRERASVAYGEANMVRLASKPT
jgi:hypothetical protein